MPSGVPSPASAPSAGTVSSEYPTAGSYADLKTVIMASRLMAQEERLPAGTRIGLYRIDSFVSRDPVASRYRARQETLDRDVILAVAAAPLGSAESDRFHERAQRLIE